MSEANPIIISDLEESEPVVHPPQPAKDSSEPVISSEETTRNEELIDVIQAPKISKKNQLQLKNWFLTFPHCATTKEEALEKLCSHPRLQSLGLKGVMIAQEKHKDNDYHLHIALWLQKTLATTDRRFFDFVCGY